MLNRYIPAEEQLRQIDEAEQGGWISEHKAHFDIKPAIAAYDDYIDNYNNRSDDENERAWCKGVGGELRKYPAWLVQEYCRADKTMDRTDSEIENETQMNRAPGQHAYGHKRGLDWWFTQTYFGGALGDKWLRISRHWSGAVRGGGE